MSGPTGANRRNESDQFESVAELQAAFWLVKGTQVSVWNDFDYDIDTVAGSGAVTINGTSPQLYANRKKTDSAVGSVKSVNGVNPDTSGNVSLNKTNFADLNNVDNTSDAQKPVSLAQQNALDAKVDKVSGKQLSDENYTLAEKNKLAGLDESLFKGTYQTEGQLAAAHPTAQAGSYAYVDAGGGADTLLYIWDESDTKWVNTGGSGGTETPATIKTKYESNADTNAFTDNAKNAVDNLPTDLAGKQDTLVSGTNIKTVAGQSILGSGDIPALTSVPVATESTFGGFKYTLTDGGKTLNLFTS